MVPGLLPIPARIADFRQGRSDSFCRCFAIFPATFSVAGLGIRMGLLSGQKSPELRRGWLDDELLCSLFGVIFPHMVWGFLPADTDKKKVYRGGQGTPLSDIKR